MPIKCIKVQRKAEEGGADLRKEGEARARDLAGIYPGANRGRVMGGGRLGGSGNLLLGHGSRTGYRGAGSAKCWRLQRPWGTPHPCATRIA